VYAQHTNSSAFATNRRRDINTEKNGFIGVETSSTETIQELGSLILPEELILMAVSTYYNQNVYLKAKVSMHR
jgi:hypothetical protein